MADNVEITAGTGTTIATDDVSGIHYQRVKLVDGTLNGTAAIPGDATNGLDVDVTRVSGNVTVVQGTAANLKVDASGAAVPVTDNSGSLTIDGAVTANAGTNLNTSALALESGGNLASIKTNTDKIPAQGQALMAASLPVAIASNQSALPVTDNSSTLSVDDGAGSLTVDGTVAATQSGTWSVRVQDGSGNTIGSTSNALDVNIKSGASSGTQYTEDAAAAADPVGGAMILVRADSPSAVTTTDGDNVAARGTNKGELYVKHIDAIPVTDNAGALTVDNAGTFAVQAAQSGTWNVGTLTTITNVVHIDDNASTVSIDDGAGSITVDGSVSIGAAIPAGSNAIGKLAANSGVDIGDVDVTSIVMPTGASAAQVQGTVAHDSAAAQNPVLNGGYAANTEPTAVANADAVRMICDLVGKQIVLPYANPENFVSGATSDITNTTATSVIAAAGAGVRNYITQILVTNSHATVGTFVNITDGSGGTILYTGYAAAAGGGFAVTLPVPIKTTANTALYCACVTTGSNVRVCASGYKGV